LHSSPIPAGELSLADALQKRGGAVPLNPSFGLPTAVLHGARDTRVAGMVARLHGFACVPGLLGMSADRRTCQPRGSPRQTSGPVDVRSALCNRWGSCHALRGPWARAENENPRTLGRRILSLAASYWRFVFHSSVKLLL
jgi:hypothetical protein